MLSKMLEVQLVTILIVASLKSFALDSQPPDISSFTFSPTTVDVTSEDAVVTLTANVTDNVGVTEGSNYRISLGNSSDTWMTGSFVLVSGTPQDGVWEASVPITMETGAGDWYVQMTRGFMDAAGNYAVRRSDETSPLTILSNTIIDTERPAISSFTFSPTTVDVTSEDAVVTLTANVTDNVGVTEGSNYRISLGNSSDTWMTGSFVLVSGTPQDGVWEASVPITMETGAGDWYVQMTRGFMDAAGNYAVRRSDETSPLTILSNTIIDTERPAISSFTFSPTTVDVTSEDAVVTLTANVTDNVGVTEGSNYRISLGNSSDTWMTGSFVLVSGTPQDGVWEASVPITMETGAGDWYVQMTRGFMDAAGNYAVRRSDETSSLLVIDRDTDDDGINDDSDIFPDDTSYSTDTDSDGMPDAWEIRYGLDPNDASDATSDQDNDGVAALDEFLAGTIPAGSLDIDGNGQYDALTDGLLLLRGMFLLSGDSLISDAVASDAVYKTSGEVASRIDMLGDLVDIDGNGSVDALTDGLVILRYLFNLRGDVLINDVIASDATVKTAEDVEASISILILDE